MCIPKKILHVLTATGHLKETFWETKCSTLEDETEAEYLISMLNSFGVSWLLHSSNLLSTKQEAE